MDFRYLAQAKRISSTTITAIDAALAEFHEHKQSILDIGARVGKKGNQMDHFQIPKLELTQSVTSNITYSGAVIQWSADPTEHAHIIEVKVPVRSSNKKSFEPQICHYLDRSEKRRHFDLATSIQEAITELDSTLNVSKCCDDENIEDYVEVDVEIEPQDRKLIGPARIPTNFFSLAHKLSTDPPPTTPLLLRTFSTSKMAFHLNHKPDISHISIDNAAEMFGLADLRPALADFVSRSNENPPSSRPLIGG